MPSKSNVPPRSRQARTLFASPIARPIATLRNLAASWRTAAPFQRQILNGLNDGRPVYQGTANINKVARRRARNKVAARSRRINRMRAAR